MTASTVELPEHGSYFLQKFRLYETRSKFYMIGRDKSRSLWKVLKIDRLEPTELNIHEDSTIYTEAECYDLLIRIHEGNNSIGGLRFVTTCYGIIGFIKFLGPYYMLLITKRRKIGAIGAHTIYGIAKSQMIPLSNATGRTSMAYSKIENRYKKLLCSVDLTKDFFFSYSYHVMRSLQKNICEGLTGEVLYEKMFVWNEFLTRDIRDHLKNTLWTVALVHGFFKQEKLSISGRDFKLTLIARRSRHYAGTRFLKRGVNEKGRVANDVETEQIVFEDAPEGHPLQMSSVVQNRVSQNNQNYEATRLHFDNLFERYGHPIIILNLIKTREKKPRESILRAEFANAIEYINKDLSGESRLKFLHWDIHKHCRRKNTNVLSQLCKVSANALNLTGFFYHQVTPELTPEGSFNLTSHERDGASHSSAPDDDVENVDNIEKGIAQQSGDTNENQSVKPPMFQKGVLRTNCIDCLDRTNVAQYSYGLAALGHQLHALGIINTPIVDLSSPLADDLVRLYEAMGDTLALQYGGSPAHNKIFSERRGQWKAAIQSQELFRTLQRYYSNAYMDAEKQDAINIFLGHFQPQEGKPALWELDSDQHCNVGPRDHAFGGTSRRFKRSLSEGILGESNTPALATNIWERMPEASNGLSECTPEISICETDLSYSRYTPSMTRKQIFTTMQSDKIYFDEDALNCSNFVDFDWLSSSENSGEEELCERSALINSPCTGLSSENVVSEIMLEATPPPTENGSSTKEQALKEAELSLDSVQNSTITDGYSNIFVHWIKYGLTLCHPSSA
ncbi:Phosphoinositide phosphatase sac2 [Thalictrum thalictroides]|uniref:Phosphoinositide phosphatase sac2 n=1 Tax=Thalictrum thalictroides TaxID=46969 RepID=A0A7J6UVN7_THATH|nr:Phosphoinositide phosphatase sac2 [Thalictrum thalictroides]